jgi:hypothetical protein
MSKLAKMQEAKLEQLRLLSSAGRNQLEEALEQQKSSVEISAPVAEPDPVPPTATEPQPSKEPLRKPQPAASKRTIRTHRIGRPPFGPDMRASTVYLPEAAYSQLETLAGKSGKKGFKRPGLSETVRAVIRLVTSRDWSPEEIREAFSEPPEE